MKPRSRMALFALTTLLAIPGPAFAQYEDLENAEKGSSESSSCEYERTSRTEMASTITRGGGTQVREPHETRVLRARRTVRAN